MEEVKKEISELNENVTILIHTIQELKKAEKVLRQEIGDLRSEIENQKEQIKFLGEKNKMVNLASAIEPKEKAEMRLKIKDLVREIDGCIAMLNT